MSTQPLKYSHQREAIMDYLKSTVDHPTADEVYNHIRESIPNISLGTVYRNLNQLAAAGKLLRLTCDGKIDHFDACTSPHYHFLCNTCGRVSDLHMPMDNELLSRAREFTPNKVTDVSIMFSGICTHCLSK